MARVHVIDCPGLSHALLAHVPAGSELGRLLAGNTPVSMTPTWPAVTCSVQATLTTGMVPSKHGIVGNGVATYRSAADADLTDPDNHAAYRRQVSFWEQSNAFLQVPRFWQDAHGKSRIKSALVCMQHSMPGFGATRRPAADIVLTPKPDHGPDGKLARLCWSEPESLVGDLFRALGPFPLMQYWGPLAGLKSSQWIAQAAAIIWNQHQPQLQFTYIPHLDYDLQRFGPASAEAARAVGELCGVLDGLISAIRESGGIPIVLSEYAIHPVESSFAPNRALREAGLLRLKKSDDGMVVDYAASDAFAMVDHQTAHVFVSSPGRVAATREALKHHSLSIHTRNAHDAPEWRMPFTFNPVHHGRGGDLQISAPPGVWLDYRWWSDPTEAPVFARTVDIHRKPGYDPLELFFDPAARAITDNAALVRGSHGTVHPGEALFIGPPMANTGSVIHAEDVAGVLQLLLAGVE